MRKINCSSHAEIADKTKRANYGSPEGKTVYTAALGASNSGGIGNLFAGSNSTDEIDDLKFYCGSHSKIAM